MTTNLTIADVARMTGLARDTINKHRHRGVLPPPDEVILGHPTWCAETIETWMATRAKRGRARKDGKG